MSSFVKFDSAGNVLAAIPAVAGQVLVAQNTTVNNVSPLQVARFAAAAPPIGTSVTGIGGTIDASVANTLSINTTSSGVIKIADAAGNHLQFFSGVGSAQIAGAGITTVAQLVTALQAYGLLS